MTSPVTFPTVVHEGAEVSASSIDSYVVTHVPVCSPETTVEALLHLLVGGGYTSVSDVAVCTADSRFLGLVALESVLGADQNRRAGDLMDVDAPVVALGLDREKAAWRAARHGGSSVAVVDERGAFRGLVPTSRLLGVLLAEHDQDLARLGGYLDSADSARHAMEEPMMARLGHRMPWLLLGLLGSAGAAVLVSGFESVLATDVRLAFFIPGIVYMADAVGTQTEALVIRGLSVGVSIRRVFRAETLTGLLVGLVLAVLAVLGVGFVLGSVPLAITVGLSLLGACTVASVVAMLLPWVMSRLGQDPAFGSGPLATVIQDLLSLMLYFFLAAVILG